MSRLWHWFEALTTHVQARTRYKHLVLCLEREGLWHHLELWSWQIPFQQDVAVVCWLGLSHLVLSFRNKKKSIKTCKFFEGLEVNEPRSSFNLPNTFLAPRSRRRLERWTIYFQLVLRISRFTRHHKKLPNPHSWRNPESLFIELTSSPWLHNCLGYQLHWNVFLIHGNDK